MAKQRFREIVPMLLAAYTAVLVGFTVVQGTRGDGWLWSAGFNLSWAAIVWAAYGVWRRRNA